MWQIRIGLSLAFGAIASGNIPAPLSEIRLTFEDYRHNGEIVVLGRVSVDPDLLEYRIDYLSVSRSRHDPIVFPNDLLNILVEPDVQSINVSFGTTESEKIYVTVYASSEPYGLPDLDRDVTFVIDGRNVDLFLIPEWLEKAVQSPQWKRELFERVLRTSTE